MIHYRLGCARAVNRFPQVVAPLRDGQLCMTTLAELSKAMTDQNCDELLARALGKSSREAKRIVAAEKPKHVPQREVTRSLVAPQVTAPLREKDAPIEPQGFGPAAEQPVRTDILTESLARVSFTVDLEYEELLKGVRAALSHKLPGAPLLDLIKEGFRRIIKQDEKRNGIVDKPRANRVGKQGKISQSDIQDRRKGGEGTPDNLIQLCQTHNLLAAEIAWGEQYIERFRKRPRKQAPEELQSRLDLPEPH